MAKKLQEIAFFCDYRGSAAASSQLQIVHTYGSHHTKGELWNSLMKAAAPTFQILA